MMNRTITTIRTAIVLVALQSLAAHSDNLDIDYDAARRAYELQQTVAATAQQRYNTALSHFTPYTDALSNAQSQLNSVSSQLSSASTQLADLGNQLTTIQQNINSIQSQDQSLRNRSVDLRRNLAGYADNLRNLERTRPDLEREIERLRRQLSHDQNTGQWVCTYVDRGQEEHRGGHRSSNDDRQQADDAAKAACEAVHKKCTLRDCDRKSDRTDELQEQLTKAEQRRDQLVNDINTAQIQVRDAQAQLDQNQQDQITNQQNLTNAQTQYTQVSTQRDQALQYYNNASNQHALAVSDVARAQANVDQQRPYVDGAKSDLDSENAQLANLLSYYQQVLRNYQAEKDSASLLGQNSGSRDGSKEGQERSAPTATDDAQTPGRDRGRVKGTADAAKRSYVRGYIIGRTDGSTLGDVASSYQAGLKDGRDQAERKAMLETLPAGYNDAFAKKLAETPAQSAAVDITEAIPTDAGSNGRDLRNLHLNPTLVPAPGYSLPKDVIESAPPSTKPTTIQIPSQDNRHSRQPCDGLRRTEFVDLCKQSYTSAYAQSYRSSYQSNYSAVFSSAFSTAAALTYKEAFKKDNLDELAKGKIAGAQHLGILNGFAERLASAKQEQYALGASQLNADLATGHLIVAKSVTLNETSGDGLLQPGEKATLSIVIDNLGQLATPLEKVRLRLTNTANATSISVPMRALPALAPATRTTLTGVLSAVSSIVVAGDHVTLEGVVELQQDNDTVVEIGRFVAKQASHFPLELVAIEPAAALPIGPWTKVPVKIQNLTNKEIVNTKVRLSTKPKTIDVFNPEGVTIEKLAPGETRTYTIAMNPSVWAGGAPDQFSFETLDAAGKSPVMEQRLRKSIAVARSAKLTLITANGQVSDGSPLVVRAGSTVSFKTRFDFLSTTRRGPYVVRFASASDPTIRAYNSTVSSEIGYWSPGFRMNPVEFRFSVPASLAGKSGWIAIELNEAGGAIQMLQVWLDVR